MPPLAWALSALGDTALLAPASLALLLYLAVLRRWAEARAFAAALAFGLSATLASKLLFKACGGAIAFLDITSPSGHASFATLFYGSLALLVAWRRPPVIAALIVVPAALLVLAIGASRPFQGAHSWEEVALGWLIGLAGLGLLCALLRPARPRPLSPVPIAIGLVLAVVVVDGRHFTPERYIGRAARAASAALDVCAAPRVTGLTLAPATTMP